MTKAALLMGKEPEVSIVQENGWVPQPAQTLPQLRIKPKASRL